jgi:Transglutaminase-like superfamily
MASGEFVVTAKRRTRRVANLLIRPGDLWLALRMAAWRLVLPALKRRMPLEGLIDLMWTQAPAEPARPGQEARVADLAAMVFRSEHPYRYGNCLERSLVLCRYLSAIGADPELIVGFKRGEEALVGHAWVVVRSEAVAESLDSLERYAKVVTYRDEGSGVPRAGRGILRTLR